MKGAREGLRTADYFFIEQVHLLRFKRQHQGWRGKQVHSPSKGTWKGAGFMKKILCAWLLSLSVLTLQKRIVHLIHSTATEKPKSICLQKWGFSSPLGPSKPSSLSQNLSDLKQSMQSDRRLSRKDQCCPASLRTGEGQKVKLITPAFSNMRWQWLKETLSWPNTTSNQCLLCWGYVPLSVLLGVCSGSRSELMVYTAMCNHWNISFHGLSALSGNLHGPRLKAPAVCLPVCHSVPRPIRSQLSDKHLHGSMGWFIQHNLAAAQRFVS